MRSCASAVGCMLVDYTWAAGVCAEGGKHGISEPAVPSVQVSRLTDMYKKTQPVRIYAEDDDDEEQQKK